MNADPNQRHWLLRPGTLRLLYWLGATVLALTVLAQVWVDLHAEFGIDGWFGFNAGFGFLSCVLMVLVAKVLGYFVKRPQKFYRQDD
jgi:hypothetical protein